jgi:hypothetical protein
MSDPRCAGLLDAAPGAGRTLCAENGASLPGFCGNSRKPDSPAFAEEPIGEENAVSEEPIIIARSMCNIG